MIQNSCHVVYCMCLMNNQVAFKVWMRNYANYHLNQFQIDLMMQILDPKCTSMSQKLIDRVCFMALPLGKNDGGVMAIMPNWCKKRTCMSTIKVATYSHKGHWKQLNWISHYCMTPNLFKVLVQWCNQDWKELHSKLVNYNERPKTCWISSKQTRCLQVMATKLGASIKRNRNLWTPFWTSKILQMRAVKKASSCKTWEHCWSWEARSIMRRNWKHKLQSKNTKVLQVWHSSSSHISKSLET